MANFGDDQHPVVQSLTAKLLYLTDGGGAIRRKTLEASGDPDTDFATLARELALVALFSRNTAWVLTLAAGFAAKVPDGYVWPQWNSPDLLLEDPLDTNFGGIIGPVTLRALPVVDQAISVGHIVSQTGDATTGLRTVVTDLTFTVDQYKGFKLYDANGLAGVIRSNTAHNLVTTCRNALVAPLRIAHSGASITNDALGVLPTVSLEGVSASVAFQGVDLLTANGNLAVFFNGGVRSPTFQGCTIEGFALTDCSNAAATACYFTDKTVGANQVTYQNCFFDGSTFDTFQGGGLDKNFEQTFSACAADGCDYLGFGFSFGAAGILQADHCDVANGSIGGFVMTGPGYGFLINCKVTACDIGLYQIGPNFLQIAACVVNDCTNEGTVQASGARLDVLTSSTGTGNAIGNLMEYGGALHELSSAACGILGTANADFSIGQLAMKSRANLTSAGAIGDVLVDTGSGDNSVAGFF